MSEVGYKHRGERGWYRESGIRRVNNMHPEVFVEQINSLSESKVNPHHILIYCSIAVRRHKASLPGSPKVSLLHSANPVSNSY